MWYMVVVYLLIPTSNHNLNLTNKIQSEVVYLLIPTSNHNVKQWHSHVLKLYIFWFLHQTTTRLRPALILGRCISFDSYIKPQRLSYWWRLADVVYLLIPTSNHNFRPPMQPSAFVVYLLIPTSNHNLKSLLYAAHQLYIFWFLHQTTTGFVQGVSNLGLYIFWFLHQTTTNSILLACSRSCISFDSYIKPQPFCLIHFIATVVYLLIPTSNHNYLSVYPLLVTLYIFWFLHQTTTGSYINRNNASCISFDSYIKPQLITSIARERNSCISFDSYIKPQLFDVWLFIPIVVYLLIPTSNHNDIGSTIAGGYVVYLLIPTSNHNPRPRLERPWTVVYLLIPTSNHNFHYLLFKMRWVVYLLIPTSNHNLLDLGDSGW